MLNLPILFYLLIKYSLEFVQFRENVSKSAVTAVEFTVEGKQVYYMFVTE